jgi:bla regulator protein blaR1
MGEAGGAVGFVLSIVRRLPSAGALWRGLLAAATLAAVVVSWGRVLAQAAPSPDGPGESAVTASPAAAAPAVPAKLLEFAVASIKPDKSGSRFVRLWFGEEFTANNVPLNVILREAFNVNEDQMIGEPEWTAGAHYDIEAKVDDADIPAMQKLSYDVRREMVRQLLVERFGLKYHEETKDVPVYVLVVAKGGPKLREATPGESYEIKGPDGTSGAGYMARDPNGRLTAQGVELRGLVRILSQQTGRTVIDKTGLTGKYDFTLQMPPMRPPMATPSPGEASGAAPDDTGPSIFTDVEEQLGLKLDSQKAPLSVYVIDRIEQPSEN